MAGNAKRRTVEISNKSYVHLFVGGRPTSRSASKWKMGQYLLGVALNISDTNWSEKIGVQAVKKFPSHGQQPSGTKKSVGLVCQHGNHCFGMVQVNK